MTIRVEVILAEQTNQLIHPPQLNMVPPTGRTVRPITEQNLRELIFGTNLSKVYLQCAGQSSPSISEFQGVLVRAG